MFLPHRDKNNGPRKLKASVLPMSYADPELIMVIVVSKF